MATKQAESGRRPTPIPALHLGVAARASLTPLALRPQVSNSFGGGGDHFAERSSAVGSGTLSDQRCKRADAMFAARGSRR